MQAGGEAQRGSKHAHQHVAQADVEQNRVNGRPQAPVPSEHQQRQRVVDNARHQNDAKAQRHRRVAVAAQAARSVRFAGSARGAVRWGSREATVHGAEVAGDADVDHHGAWVRVLQVGPVQLNAHTLERMSRVSLSVMSLLVMYMTHTDTRCLRHCFVSEHHV